MNAALELHDSDVAKIAGTGGCLRVTFSRAYVHRSVGRPGVDAGSGYLQPAELVLSGGAWPEPMPDCRGAISDGSLVINGEAMSLIPLPLTASGLVTLHLAFASGTEFSASVSSVTCTASGEPHYVESFSGK